MRGSAVDIYGIGAEQGEVGLTPGRPSRFFLPTPPDFFGPP